MSIRPASHAGQWYEAVPDRLVTALTRFMRKPANAATLAATESAGVPSEHEVPPGQLAVMVAPHAGLNFSGPVGGVAYRYMRDYLVGTAAAPPTPTLRRIFILGPSHTMHFRGVALTSFAEFATPFGNIEVDRAGCAELAELLADASTRAELPMSARASSDSSGAEDGRSIFQKIFDATGSSDASQREAVARAAVPVMTLPVEHDIKEHCIEMQLPFIGRILAMRRAALAAATGPVGGGEVRIVPVVVGDLTRAQEHALGEALHTLLFLRDKTAADTALAMRAAAGFRDSPLPRKVYRHAGEGLDAMAVVSTDFSHWGQRFKYQHMYEPNAEVIAPPSVNVTAAAATTFDADGVAQTQWSVGDRIEVMDHQGMQLCSAGDVDGWEAYLAATGNTICGRRAVTAAIVALQRPLVDAAAMLRRSSTSSSAPSSRGLGGSSSLAEGQAPSRFVARLSFVEYGQSSRCVTMKDSSVSYASAVAFADL
jgi:predicted class III extradiol MEMO1 family dioxygenase